MSEISEAPLNYPNNDSHPVVRVLHVLDIISVYSGVSSVVMNYFAKLNHREITFDFMLNEDTDPTTRAYIESYGSKIYIMPGLKLSNLFKYISALKNFFKHHKYEIVHGHIANSAVFYLGAARKTVPIRIIHSHNTNIADIIWKRVRNWLLTRFIKMNATEYAACSNDAAKFLFGKGAKAKIINNAINIEKFVFRADKRNIVRTELGVGDNILIGHIGRFTAQKNHDFLLDVFARVHKINPATVLLMIGNGKLLSQVLRKSVKLGIDDAVIRLDPKDNISDYMCAMDIFVLPSLFEGLPLVAVEAQASGLPVFLSDCITRDVDITGSTVFLPLNFEQWVSSLQNNFHYDRIESASTIKGSRYDISTQTKVLCDYYKELLINGI